jgi:hypothetical protein
MSHGVRLAAACLLAAAASVVLSATPATAATCSSAGGVSVAVDFHELGGGAQTACVADGGGRSATSLLTSAGFVLSYVQRQPGFVCRVNGAPADDPCVNTPAADAYWGLWWSDGRSGSWTYATTAAGSLKVPKGGYVAFSWNGSAARSTPGVSPTAHSVAPTPNGKPTSKPSAKPSSKPSTPEPSRTESSSTESSSAESSSAEPSPSSTKSEKPSPSATVPPGKVGQPTKSPGGVAGEMLPESPETADPPDDGGVPTWVGPVVVVVLFAAGGAVAVVRRRRNPTP